MGRLENYFPQVDTADMNDLIKKMHLASNKMVCAQIHSPAELSIQDASGRQVGMVNGIEVNDFPMAVYDPDQEFAHILLADANYTYRVVGIDTGEYGLDITIIHDGN